MNRRLHLRFITKPITMRLILPNPLKAVLLLGLVAMATITNAQQAPGGGPIYWEPGTSGFYISDNVNDRARTNFAIPSGSFTVELTYRLCDSELTNPERIIDALGSTVGLGFEVTATSSGFQVRTKASVGGVQTTNVSYAFQNTDWRYFTYAYNAADSMNQIWVDGFPTDPFQAPITPYTSITFGGFDSSDNASFNGFLEDIIISDTILYANEPLLASIYPAMTEHAVAKWSFEDGQNAMVFVDSVAGHLLLGQGGAHAIAIPEGIAQDTIVVVAGSSVMIEANGGAICTWTPSTGLSSETGISVMASPEVDTWYTVEISDSSECAPVFFDEVFIRVVAPEPGVVPENVTGVYYSDGDGDKAVYEGNVIPNESDFTLEMVFNACGQDLGKLFDQLGSTAGYGVHLHFFTPTQLEVRMRALGGTTHVENITLTEDVTGAWHHLALTHHTTDSINTVYFDGVEVASFVSGFTSLSAYTVIGNNDHNDGASFHGRIDDVRISDVVRYTGFFGVETLAIEADANTVALWNFEDGQNSITMADLSGNGYDMAGEGGGHVNAPFGSSQYAEYFGIPVQIEAYGGSICSWTPTDGLDDATVFNPMASPTESGYYYVTVTDTNACYTYQDSVYIEVDLTTVGIDGNSISEVVVYPNPANGNQGFKIYGLDNSFTYNAQLLDIAGHLIQTQALKEGHWFSTTGVATGVYLLSLQRKDGGAWVTVDSIRIVIQAK